MDQALRSYILTRDGGCIARLTVAWCATLWPMFQGLPEPGECRNTWGDVISPFELDKMTIEEVKAELRAGRKAGYSKESCVCVCPGHHFEGRGPGAKWCTKAVVREAVRLYIPAANEKARERGVVV